MGIIEDYNANGKGKTTKRLGGNKKGLDDANRLYRQLIDVAREWTGGDPVRADVALTGVCRFVAHLIYDSSKVGRSKQAAEAFFDGVREDLKVVTESKEGDDD